MENDLEQMKHLKLFEAMKELKPCPYCKSTDSKDCYVYICCNDCLMTGPKMNNDNNDAQLPIW